MGFFSVFELLYLHPNSLNLLGFAFLLFTFIIDFGNSMVSLSAFKTTMRRTLKSFDKSRLKLAKLLMNRVIWKHHRVLSNKELPSNSRKKSYIWRAYSLTFKPIFQKQEIVINNRFLRRLRYVTTIWGCGPSELLFLPKLFQ